MTDDEIATMWPALAEAAIASHKAYDRAVREASVEASTACSKAAAVWHAKCQQIETAIRANERARQLEGITPPAVGAEYERPHAEDALERGTYILRATHTEETAELQPDGSVKTKRFTICFFFHKKYPLGYEYSIASIDCDHKKRIIHR